MLPRFGTARKARCGGGGGGISRGDRREGLRRKLGAKTSFMWGHCLSPRARRASIADTVERDSSENSYEIYISEKENKIHAEGRVRARGDVVRQRIKLRKRLNMKPTSTRMDHTEVRCDTKNNIRKK